MALSRKPQEIVEDSKNPLLDKHESWERVPVGDIADILNGFAFKSSKFTNDKGTPLIRIRDVGKDSSETFYDGEYDETYLVNDGDLLVGMDGDFRAAIWKGGKALLNQRVCKISLKTDEYDFKFLSYVLQPYLDAIHAETSAVTVKHLSSRSISEIPLPLPPKEQQKRIVAKIEELFSHIDAGIEALKKAKQLLKQYRQSVLKAAVTGELTKEWRDQNNYSKEGWKESFIGEIAKVETGKTPKRSTEEFWKNGTIPWLTSSATNKEFTHHAEQFVTQTAVDSGLKLFDSGTLLLAMYGEGKTRGQVTEITFQATCNQACAAIIVDKDKASRAFVRLRLNENYEQTRKAASGGNQPNLNLSKVREISLPLPPLAEQAEIVFQVELKYEAISRLENELVTQLFKAEKNKQSVLASAFAGKLLVDEESRDHQDEIMIAAEV